MLGSNLHKSSFSLFSVLAADAKERQFWVTQLRACAKYHMEINSKVGERRRGPSESPGWLLGAHLFQGWGGHIYFRDGDDHIYFRDGVAIFCILTVCSCSCLCTLKPEVCVGCLSF